MATKQPKTPKQPSIDSTTATTPKQPKPKKPRHPPLVFHMTPDCGPRDEAFLKFYSGRLDHLSGWVFTGLLTTGEEELGLVLTHPNRTEDAVIWILRDLEGNGPGAVETQPLTSEQEQE